MFRLLDDSQEPDRGHWTMKDGCWTDGKTSVPVRGGVKFDMVDFSYVPEKQVLFDVDVKGGINLKRILGDKAVSIFICPPSIEEQRRRLEGRGDTSPEMIEKRLAKAEYELTFKPQFDRVVVNDTLAHAFKQLDAIIDENK